MSEYIMLDGVSYAYPGSSVLIFEDLSLTLNEGFTALSGANGSGKTTLQRLISQELIPDKGTVRTSGEVVVCLQVFSSLADDDMFYIYDGSAENGRLMSRLHLTDEMIASPECLSGGEKKRLQLLAALSRHPSVAIFDEPLNHLDAENRSIILSALSDFEGCGLIITHDRETGDRLCTRTLFLERGMDAPSSLYDIPLPLSQALDEVERQKNEKRSVYQGLSAEIERSLSVASKMAEKSREMEKKLSKSGIDRHDHSAKAKIDGARLTGKDRSIAKEMKRVLSSAEQKKAKLDAMENPGRRKEGLSLNAVRSYLPSFSFGPEKLMAGDYTLSVPYLSAEKGERIALTGCNGSGKTMLMEAIRRELCESGRDQYLMYIPQEYSAEDITAITRRIEELSDSERGEVLSDLYRLGSNPSFLLDSKISPSPGELKKLDFILSRREGRNIIMMDEPTNHLDIVSVRIFERILSSDDDFTLILVSHDESFLSSLCHIRWSIRRDGNNGILSVSSFSSICDTTQV